MPSVFSSPNAVLFGRGTTKETGERLKGLGCTRVMVVYDKGVEEAGIIKIILENIHSAGIETVSYGKVLPDPPDWSVDEAGILGVEEKVDGVVGIGGGSSLDTAKGVKVLLDNPPPINQYFGRFKGVKNTTRPLLLVPTTAGTGSEQTPGGTITDTKQNAKNVVEIIGRTVDLAIVDPELTVSLPPSVTAVTGMDALCHLSESFTSQWANRYCEAFSREGIPLVGRYLVRAFEEGSDLEAREGMMFAASLGGMSMLGPLCHLGHDIGRRLGANFNMPHGLSCSMCLPQVVEYIAPAVPEKVKFIAEALNASVPRGADPAEIGRMAGEAVKEIMKKIDLPNMRSLGLAKKDVLAVAPEIFDLGLVTAPLKPTVKDIENMLTRAYEEI
ncbi:MAG: iron-containing alcohol dehydrogenase [Bacillota bacterium]|nr:iron-containing alcohol dehydrogenase [Bacillota bacterium]